MPRYPYHLMIALILLLCSAPTFARDWLVAPDGTGDAPTIAAAIDSFQSEDRIVLLDGVFSGEGNRDLTNLEKNIIIISQSDDPAQCIIDCAGNPNTPHWAMDFYGGG